MLAKLRPRLTYANVVSTICLCLVVGGGSAYAANTIGSSDVINESLLSEDIKNSEVKTSELANAAVTRDKLASTAVTNGKLGGSAVDGSKVADNSLGGADILESSLARVPNADKLDGIDSTGFVQGRGTLLSNRMVFLPGTGLYRTFLQIPGLGELKAGCFSDGADILWSNTTGGPVDVWYQFDGHVVPRVASADEFNPVASMGSSLQEPGAFVGLGVGNDPGSRRVATLNVFVYQSADNAPCGFQAQGTLWVSP
jgi:hypothetical protein